MASRKRTRGLFYSHGLKKGAFNRRFSNCEELCKVLAARMNGNEQGEWILCIASLVEIPIMGPVKHVMCWNCLFPEESRRGSGVGYFKSENKLCNILLDNSVFFNKTSKR